MCEQGPTIRLCSCDSKEINPDYMWELFSERRIIGKFIFPEPSIGDLLIKFLFLSILPIYFLAIAFGKVTFITPQAKKILDQLNNGSVFDFEYVPLDGDVLMISLKKKKYAFKYSTYRGEWAKVNKYSVSEKIISKRAGNISNKV